MSAARSTRAPPTWRWKKSRLRTSGSRWNSGLDPAAPTEHHVESGRQSNDHDSAGDQARGPAEARVGHVLAEPARHRGGYGDDRGPAGELLHDGVQAGVLQREVGLEDRGDHVAKRLSPLRDAQDMVVQVGIPACLLYTSDAA